MGKLIVFGSLGVLAILLLMAGVNMSAAKQDRLKKCEQSLLTQKGYSEKHNAYNAQRRASSDCSYREARGLL